MRICMFGVGALGGMLAARLRMAGVEVWLFDNEPVLRAIGEDGLTYVDEAGTHVVDEFRIVDHREESPNFDFIILAVKSNEIVNSLSKLTALMGTDTVVVTIQNGIPWWFFQHSPNHLRGISLESVDPAGKIEAALHTDRIVACVAYPAAQSDRPGSVRHVEGDRLSFGEPNGTRSTRCDDLKDIFGNAGFRTRVIADIRAEIWLKALGNSSFNPVSALTRMTMQQIYEFEPTRNLVTRMMREAEQLAIALGISLRVSVEKRLAGAAKVGHHKTSMLQDLEAGRPMEIDAILGSFVEIADRLGILTPTMDIVYELTTALDISNRRSQSLIQ